MNYAMGTCDSCADIGKTKAIVIPLIVVGTIGFLFACYRLCRYCFRKRRRAVREEADATVNPVRDEDGDVDQEPATRNERAEGGGPEEARARSRSVGNRVASFWAGIWRARDDEHNKISMVVYGAWERASCA